MRKSMVEVRMGHSWPEIRDVHAEEVDVSAARSRLPRHRVVLGIVILAAALLVAFTAYGMMNGDEGILGTVLTLVRDIVLAVLGWSIGRYGSL